MDERIFIMVVGVLTIGAGVTLLKPLVVALAERIKPRPPAVDTGAEAFRDEVLEELQMVRREVAELGERVDFAERLLAKSRDAAALPKPGS